MNLLGGLNTNSHTTLEFNMNLGTAISGSIYGGDLINLGSSALNVSGGTIAFGVVPTTLGDYRLFADSGSSISGLGNFVLPPSTLSDTYSLTTSADPGYIDLASDLRCGRQRRDLERRQRNELDDQQQLDSSDSSQ